MALGVLPPVCNPPRHIARGVSVIYECTKPPAPFTLHAGDRRISWAQCTADVLAAEQAAARAARDEKFFTLRLHLSAAAVKASAAVQRARANRLFANAAAAMAKGELAFVSPPRSPEAHRSWARGHPVPPPRSLDHLRASPERMPSKRVAIAGMRHTFELAVVRGVARLMGSGSVRVAARKRIARQAAAAARALEPALAQVEDFKHIEGEAPIGRLPIVERPVAFNVPVRDRASVLLKPAEETLLPHSAEYAKTVASRRHRDFQRSPLMWSVRAALDLRLKVKSARRLGTLAVERARRRRRIVMARQWREMMAPRAFTLFPTAQKASLPQSVADRLDITDMTRYAACVKGARRQHVADCRRRAAESATVARLALHHSRVNLIASVMADRNMRRPLPRGMTYTIILAPAQREQPSSLERFTLSSQKRPACLEHLRLNADRAAIRRILALRDVIDAAHRESERVHWAAVVREARSGLQFRIMSARLALRQARVTANQNRIALNAAVCAHAANAHRKVVAQRLDDFLSGRKDVMMHETLHRLRHVERRRSDFLTMRQARLLCDNDRRRLNRSQRKAEDAEHLAQLRERVEEKEYEAELRRLSAEALTLTRLAAHFAKIPRLAKAEKPEAEEEEELVSTPVKPERSARPKLPSRLGRETPEVPQSPAAA